MSGRQSSPGQVSRARSRGRAAQRANRPRLVRPPAQCSPL
jgi:hypothetical protein